MPPRTAHADRVYAQLRDGLLRGDFPVGRRLVEQQLAARFETSRTPIREALRRLEGDGHLVRDPAGGLSPAVPSVRSMRDLYDVRLAIEELVVRRAATAGNRGILDALAQDWRMLEAEWSGGRHGDGGPGFVIRDEDFHQRLAQASGNAYAERQLNDVNERIRILRIHDFTLEERVRSTITEHLEIVDAVIAQDPDGAASFMRAHVQRSALVVRERVGEALARMFDEDAD
ncbi:HTH-type transcriptional repressor RspR [Paraconexibacter sp. AEG42_29]|uniref:HTH-type transcriptional repressor RspR n=1 Tax=Paraconexibacter sp. AEG42_29 TaxID=2997339 RepID=A0AAU7AU05_9ACTN